MSMQRKTLYLLATVTCCFIFSEQAIANPFEAIYNRFVGIFGGYDFNFLSIRRNLSFIIVLLLIGLGMWDIFLRREAFRVKPYVILVGFLIIICLADELFELIKVIV